MEDSDSGESPEVEELSAIGEWGWDSGKRGGNFKKSRGFQGVPEIRRGLEMMREQLSESGMIRQKVDKFW